MGRHVQCEERGGVAVVTICRPEALNALNPDVLQELWEAMDRLGSLRHIKVIILTGMGDKAFVAGADIASMRDMSPGEAITFSRIGHQTMDRIVSMRAVTIAAINGYALGGGCELALACDMRIASTRCKMGIPEATLGVIPGFGGTQRLPRLVGLGRAIELLATGKAWGAQTCKEIGLVNHVVEPEKLMDYCMGLAEQIVKNSAIAIDYGKQCMRAGVEMDLSKALELEQRVFALTFIETDQREGMSAFLEKRPAHFI